MQWIRHRIAVVGLAVLLTGIVVTGWSHPALARDGFNDEYVYATTREVNKMDANPALKLTLYPATIIIDTAFLPFAVIAGFVT